MLRLLRVFAGVSMIAVVLACSRPREDSGYGSGAEGAAKQDVVKQTVPVGIPGSVLGQSAPLQKPSTLYLNTPALPDTIPAQQPDWDYFAWNSFIAMNWPALEIVPNQYRGVPNTSGDPGTTFVTVANDALAVWETFKEKREVFNHPTTAGQLKWYSPVDYGDPRLASGETVKTTMRTFHQNSGTSQSPDGLDETVEVQSQVLEPTLPDGSPNPVLNVLPPVVTPRVWRGLPTANNPVVYEVKVNYDYFQYVVEQGYNVNNSKPTNPVATAAMMAEIHLPWRTSSGAPPLSQGKPAVQHASTTGYRASDAVTTYQTINSSYQNKMPAPDPPKTGSVQIKAAWIKLAGSDGKAADFPTWHTAIAQNYTDVNGMPVPSEPTLFGLVGLHIIQRIHTTNDTDNAQPPGGTFIFATWEHESIYNSPISGMANQPAPTYFYSNYSAGGGIGHVPGFYPALDKQPFPVERMYPVLSGTIAVNNAVHAAIKNANGGNDSVWCHYHLVGTQFQAIDLPAEKMGESNDPTNIGQPVFLANLAIETNVGLPLPRSASLYYGDQELPCAEWAASEQRHGTWLRTQ